MNEQLFECFIDDLNFGVFAINAKLNVVYCNNWVKMHLSPSFNIKKGDSFIKFIDDRHKSSLHNIILDVIENKAQITLPYESYPYIFQIPLKETSSNLFEFMQQSVTITPSNTFDVIFISITDETIQKELTKKIEVSITEQQQLNYLLSYENEILDQNILMLKISKDGTVTDVSKAFLNLTGSKEDDFIGYRQFFLTPTQWEELIFNGRYKSELSYKIKQKIYYADLNIVPIYLNQNDSLLEYAAILHDSTDKKTIDVLRNTDLLTNLTNRIRFEEIFDYEYHQCVRYKSSLSLVAINTDNFIDINNKFGYQVGDEILSQLADLLKKNIRKTDSLARWSGNIFMLLLSKTDISGANIACEILKNIIESTTFTGTNITCSFAISSLRDGDKMDDIIARIEQSLLSAKKSGGNKIVTSD